MAKENIRKNEEKQEAEESNKNLFLNYLIKNKLIIFGFIIFTICISIPIIYKVLANEKEIIQNVNEGKKELILIKNEKSIKQKVILKKHNQELVENLKFVNKEIYDCLSIANYYDKYVDNENIIRKVKLFREKYYTYLNITRFAIPVIGSVSVGKSTLLNYILDLKNFLETGIDITTRFLCIIRHNINYKSPVISNITIEERNLLKYNFIKDTI